VPLTVLTKPVVSLQSLPGTTRAGDAFTPVASLAGVTPTASGTVTWTASIDTTCQGQIDPPMQRVVTVTNGMVPDADPVTPMQAGTVYWQATYSGDTQNGAATSACQAVVVDKATPSLTGWQEPGVVHLNEPFTIHMELPGNVAATGTVTLTSYIDAACTQPVPGRTPYVATVSSGLIPDMPPISYDLPAVVYAQAVYSGDANNEPATGECIQSTVAKFLPVSLSLSPGSTIDPGQSAAAQASWPAEDQPEGAITYQVFTGADCTGQAFTQPQTVMIANNAAPASPPVRFDEAGFYSWQVAIPDSALYNAAVVCEPLTVRAQPVLTGYQVPNPVHVGEEFIIHADIANVLDPTGTVTITAYSDAGCTTRIPGRTPYTTEIVNGEIPDMTPRIFSFPTIVYGHATYSGDANNAPATSACIASTVVTGPLTATIADQTMPEVPYSHNDQEATGQLMLIVRDPRYTSAGWSVSISSTSFSYTGVSPAASGIPAGNLAIVSIGAPVLVTGQAVGAGGPLVAATGAGSLEQDRVVVLAQPGFWAGTYYVPITVKLTIPAESQVGTYTADLIVTTLAAP